MYTYWLTYGFSGLWAIFSKLKVNVTAVKHRNAEGWSDSTTMLWSVRVKTLNLLENLWLDTKGHSLRIPTKADSILAGLKNI